MAKGHGAIEELKEGTMADTANTTFAATPAGTGATVSAGGWRTEDWIAVILGFLVIAAVLAAFHWKVVDLSNLVQSYRWTTDGQIASFSANWRSRRRLASLPSSAAGRLQVRSAPRCAATPRRSPAGGSLRPPIS
jgi:hypothetical protein